ncbi:MAG: drug resistance transporter, EmrB/QacA subfamily [Mycobacterium sp.]|nr:drug resistance transporter, EmrB/QacA subfamily [Mycobacterium sp.]
MTASKVMGRIRVPPGKNADTPPGNPWNALWAMMVGFFMILVDSTIVAVANPSIMDALKITDYSAVIWVTSAYLLAYAVPLLVAGRLGDRFGPKNLYLIGLAVFTLSSLWCGLAGSIEMLVAARVVQGIGAGLLTPQTLSAITRIFPPQRRGVAMSVWGATAGVATLVGPLAGGVLVDHLGWEWIFFVNVPIGVIGLGLAVWLIPVLPTNKHGFDPLGVVLSGVGMFLVVYGLQEGPSHNWSPWIWATIAGGVASMVAFVYWQSVNKNEPLIPLSIFRDRDFSLSNVGIGVIGFVVTAMILPVMFYTQAVCGLSPTRSALITAPMAIATGVLAPVVGRIVDRSHPRPIIGFGFSVLAIALTWLSIEMTPTTPIWRLLLPLTAMGVGMAFIWAPLAATATRNLPPHLAGAGSGVYNATRQVGSVLGSASMAAFMASRISAELPSAPGGAQRPEGAVRQLPAFLHEPFSSALAQSLLLPAFVALFGVVVALFLVGFARPGTDAPEPRRPDSGRGGYRNADPRSESRTERIPVVGSVGRYDDGAYRRPEYAGRPGHFDADDYGDDDFVDDDDYVEYTVSVPEPARPDVVADDGAPPDEADTAPMAARVEHPPSAPEDTWHGGHQPLAGDLLDDAAPQQPAAEPVVESTPPRAEPWRSEQVQSWRSEKIEPWHSLFDDLPPKRTVEPIGFAHNGFHVDSEERFRPVSDFGPPARDENGSSPHSLDDYRGEPLGGDYRSPSRHELPDDHGDAGAHYPSDREATHHRPSAGGASRHQLPDEEPEPYPPRPEARHYRDESDDPSTYGRHSMRRTD